MSEMIERVARALCAKVDGNDPDRVISTRNARVAAWQLYVDDAVIAIKAMREPTLEMRKVCSFTAAEIDYPAMIDAALKD